MKRVGSEMDVILPDPSCGQVAEPGGVSSFPDCALYLQPGIFYV
jgi:hypothetical protein